MRLFVCLAFFTLALIEIRANSTNTVEPIQLHGRYLIHPDMMKSLEDIKKTSTPEILSAGIPNKDKHEIFFKSLSEIITQSCEIVEGANLEISPIHPDLLKSPSQLMNIIDELLNKCEGTENSEIMKKKIQTTKDKLIEYGSKINDLGFPKDIDEKFFTNLIELHNGLYFEHVNDDKKFNEYMEHIKQEIKSYKESIEKHHSHIVSTRLSALNENFLESTRSFLKVSKDKTDVSGPLSKMDVALDAIMNDEEFFGGLKTNVEDIHRDLKALMHLMEKLKCVMKHYFNIKTLKHEKISLEE